VGGGDDGGVESAARPGGIGHGCGRSPWMISFIDRSDY
jgi:hypothetical protein